MRKLYMIALKKILIGNVTAEKENKQEFWPAAKSDHT